jgi:hypothetical protein
MGNVPGIGRFTTVELALKKASRREILLLSSNRRSDTVELQKHFTGKADFTAKLVVEYFAAADSRANTIFPKEQIVSYDCFAV